MARFRALIPEDPAVTVKPMFGNRAAFVHGNMFAGHYGPPERPMGGFVALPADWHTEIALAQVSTPLAKVPKARKAGCHRCRICARRTTPSAR